MKNLSTNYRRDIDGLRAIAVLAVIFYHAGFSFAPGGYIGVDVFFVISGFLISNILIAETSEGRFSALLFYERRIRRIVPALFLTVACVAAFGLLVLPPLDYGAALGTIIPSIAFFSNFYFWQTRDYFSPAAEETPLLHTWSLGVEAQFYIIFPLLFIVLWKYFSRRAAPFLVVVLVINLFFSEVLSRHVPAFNFYLLFGRFWEFLAGSITAIVLYRSPPKSNESMAIAGLLLVLAPIFLIDSDARWPSLIASLPIAGVCLAICFVDRSGIVYWFLSWWPLRWIGLVSYSAYLFHQPVFAFARIIRAGSPSAIEMIGLIIVVFIAAAISWYLVENPFRSRHVIGRRSLTGVLAGIGGVLVVFGAQGAAFAPTTYPDTLEIEGQSIDIPKKFRGLEIGGVKCSHPDDPRDACRFEGGDNHGSRVVIIGDSHARVLSQALHERLSEFRELVDLSSSGCPFVLDLTVFRKHDPTECNADYQAKRIAMLRELSGPNLVVLIDSRWALYEHATGFDNTIGGRELRGALYASRRPRLEPEKRKAEYLEALRRTISETAKIAGAVVVVKSTHTNGWSVVRRAQELAASNPHLTKRDLEAELALPIGPILERLESSDKLIDELSRKHGNVLSIDPKSFTCSKQKSVCYGFRDNKLLFSDSNHLALTSNRWIVGEFSKLLGNKGAIEDID